MKGKGGKRKDRGPPPYFVQGPGIPSYTTAEYMTVACLVGLDSFLDVSDLGRFFLNNDHHFIDLPAGFYQLRLQVGQLLLHH